MENKKLTEKLFLILGVIFLFVGLWNFIDFSKINKYTLQSILFVLSIVTYVAAAKNKESSYRVSTVFAAISLGLSLTSIFLLRSILKVTSIDWILVIMVGIYLLAFLTEFKSRFLYFIAGIFSFYSSSILYGEPLVISIAIYVFTIFYACVLVIRYIDEHNENKWLSVPQGMAIVFLFVKLQYDLGYEILDGILDLDFILPYICVLITMGSLFCICKYLVLPKGFTGVFKFCVIVCSLFLTNKGFWEAELPEVVAIILSIVCAIVVIGILIKKILDGYSKYFWLLVLHSSNIVLSNLYGVLPMSIFLMILGATLLILGIFINKNKIKVKGDCHE